MEYPLKDLAKYFRKDSGTIYGPFSWSKVFVDSFDVCDGDFHNLNNECCGDFKILC